MEREQRVRELASWLIAEIVSFAEYQNGKMSLLTLCRILAKSVLNLNLVKGEQNET